MGNNKISKRTVGRIGTAFGGRLLPKLINLEISWCAPLILSALCQCGCGKHTIERAAFHLLNEDAACSRIASLAQKYIISNTIFTFVY